MKDSFLESQNSEWAAQCTVKALIENDNWEEIVGRCHAHIYEPRETLGILLSLEITPLPTKSFLSYYPLRILRAWTMGYKDNTWIF